MENIKYCKWENSSSISAETSDFGYWNICGDCGKPIEDGFHYYDQDDVGLY